MTPVDFEHVSSEINPQFAQIADENDLVVLNRFESDHHATTGGFIDLVIPYMSLKPVRDLLRSRVQTGDGDEESDKVWRRQLSEAVYDASLEMQVLLGNLSQTARQIQALKEGDVIFFKKPDHARVVIRDMPVFDVEVGTLGSQVAVKVVNAVKLSDGGSKQG